MAGDIVVSIAPGNYWLAESIIFDERDSGQNGFDVVYASEDEQRPARIIGGKPARDWLVHSGSIVKTYVGHTNRITTLIENGARGEEARFPNREDDADSTDSQATYLISANRVADFSSIEVHPKDFDVFRSDLTAARIYIWSGHDWFADVLPIGEVDAARGRVKLKQDARYPITGGNRYFFLGALEMLDRPGEFFHDLQSGFLYYWPRSPEVESSEIILPILKSAIMVISPTPDMPVHNLRLENLRIEASTFPEWYRFGWPRAGESGESHLVSSFDRQIEMPSNRFGLVTLENTRQLVLSGLHLRHAGLSSLYFRFQNQDNCVHSSLIEHSGINGITVQGRYPGEGDVARRNQLTNNWIRVVGEMVGGASGVDISNASDNEVSHSLIEHSPRFGVTWHAGVFSEVTSYVQGNHLHHLRLHRAGTDSGDMGAVYAFGLTTDYLAAPRTNIAEQIWISGVTSHASLNDIPPNAVFMDNNSAGQVLRNIYAEGVSAPVYRENSGPHVMQNVSWIADQDLRSLEFDAIGLRRDFPDHLRR